MKPSERVVVDIQEPSEYAFGAAECLQGKTGTITAVSHATGAWLVQFDTPAKTWWANQTPTTEFWLPPKDLKVIQ